MTNHYITVTSDQFNLDDQIISANQLLTRRIENGKFPLYSGTSHKDKINVGDICYMYAAGKKEYKHHVVGSFVVADVIQNGLTDEFEDVLSSTPYKYLIMTKITRYIDPLYIKDLVNELEFIKNKSRWGVFFQGGVKKISLSDALKLDVT